MAHLPLNLRLLLLYHGCLILQAELRLWDGGEKVLSRTLPFWSQPVVFYFIFGWAGSLLLLWTFSSCGEHGLLPSFDAQASHCGGFSGAEHQL